MGICTDNLTLSTEELEQLVDSIHAKIPDFPRTSVRLLVYQNYNTIVSISATDKGLGAYKSAAIKNLAIWMGIDRLPSKSLDGGGEGAKSLGFQIQEAACGTLTDTGTARAANK